MTPTLQGPAPTVAPPAWASVRLVEGRSEANTWHVDSSTARAQLAVGSGESCAWRISAAGVEHVHFELWWDGRRLWISDTRGAGGVTVDGAPIGDWQELPGRARIEFGRAAMIAESSVPAVWAADVEAAPPEMPAHEAPTLVAEPSAILRRRRPGTVPPGTVPPGVPLLRAPSPSAAATVIMPRGRPMAATPPGGLAAPPVAGPGPSGSGLSGPFSASGARPLLGPAVASRPALSLPARTWLFIAAVVGVIAFVLFEGTGASEAPAESAAASQSSEAAGKGAASSEGAAPASEGPVASGQGAASGSTTSDGAAPSGGGAGTAGAGAATSADGAATSGAAPSGAGITAEAAGAGEPVRRGTPVPGARASERLAADLLAAGRQREALAVYDELSRSRPSDPVFAAIASMLERRLAANCQDLEPGGTPCAQ
jgi:hypothetical protein